MVGEALIAGVVAGLGVALPLGPIGILILNEGLTRGWRRAAAAATGVALVDLGYATLAVAAGGAMAATLIRSTRTVQLAGAAMLLAVAVHGLFARPGSASGAAVTSDALSTDDVEDAVLRVLGRFAALTAVNPLTAVYFVVMATGLGTMVAGWRAAGAFMGGAFASSLAWQLILAGIGAFTGARLPGWARTGIGVVGNLLVLGYAARLAVG
jgi:arginine exporter protein ArgO